MFNLDFIVVAQGPAIRSPNIFTILNAIFILYRVSLLMSMQCELMRRARNSSVRGEAQSRFSFSRYMDKYRYDYRLVVNRQRKTHEEEAGTCGARAGAR